MNASFASQKTRRKLHRKVFEGINQNEEHLVNICESNILESHSYHRVIGNGCIHLLILAVSKSVSQRFIKF